MAKGVRNKQILGMIGVYFIGVELSRKGLVAVPTSRNVKSTDMLATNSNGTKSVTLQVKTRQGADFVVASFHNEPSNYEEGNEWLEDEISPSPTKLYAFVKIDSNGAPQDYWVVPSDVVLREVRKVRDEWLGGSYIGKPTRLATRGKNIGQRIKDQGAWTIEPNNNYSKRLDILMKLLAD